MIASEVLDRFACNRCGAAAEAPATDTEPMVVCVQGHQFPMAEGYLDARLSVVDRKTEETFASFGFEWTHFSDVQPENLSFWERYFEDVPAAALEGAVAVDVGCGMARYSQVTSTRVKHLVAVDGSDAIGVAVQTLEDRPNATCIRADLRTMPLAPRSFDFVSCLGVLHHLSDPPSGFAKVADLVGDRGYLLVYLYSRPSGLGVRQVALKTASLIRKVTVRLPHGLLRVACWPAALLLHFLFVTPGALGARRGNRSLQRLPLDAYRGKPLRALWLDTFDRLSAPVEHRYRWEDVAPWFEDAGFEIVAVREFGGLMITARRAD